MDISEIDQNYKNIFRSAGMTTYSVNEPPFALYGLCREPGEQDQAPAAPLCADAQKRCAAAFVSEHRRASRPLPHGQPPHSAQM